MNGLFGPRYEIVRRVGEGGFGTVYEAFDRERKSPVAIKALSRLDAASLYRFKREFRLFADLDHPYLVKLYELGNEGEQWFFTMELLQGKDWLSHVRPEDALRRGLAAANTEVAPTQASPVGVSAAADDLVLANTVQLGGAINNNPVRLENLRKSIGEVVQALCALHSVGVVHRDLKPSNVIVTEEGRTVLLDFGIATSDRAETAHLTDPNAIVGTPAYMAPEQATGQGVTGAVDLYALGVMLYEALTGQLPFAGAALQILYAKMGTVPRTPAEIAPDVPQDLADLCMALLATAPGDRPTDAALLELLGLERVAELLEPVRPRSSSTISTSNSGTGSFVGRQDSLELLNRSLEGLQSGTPCLVEISGPSGVGKSALVQQFLSGLGPQVVKLHGRCFQRETVPYNAFDNLVDGLSRYLRTLSSSESAKLVPRDASILMRIFPVLGRVPCFAEAPRKAAQIQDPHQLRSKAFGALRELLSRMSDRGPVVLTMDDVQWGDADSAWLLAELLSPPEPPPLLVVVTYRIDEAQSSDLLRELERRLKIVGVQILRERLVLGGLSRQEAKQLALAMLVGREDAEVQANQIVQEAQGSPFLLGELALQLLSGAEQHHAGTLSVDALVQERVSRLPEHGRHILSLVAIADRGVPFGVLSRAAELDEESTRKSVSQLRLAKLIRLAGARGEVVEPYHDRVREAVSDNVSAAERGKLHGRLALALNETVDVDPETLFRHYLAAGMLEQAQESALKAAENASKALAFDRVVALFDAVLMLRGQNEMNLRLLRRERADALVRAGRGVMAAEAYFQLAVDADASERIELEKLAGEQLLYAGEFERGVAVLRRVLDSVGIWLPKGYIVTLLAVLALRVWVQWRDWRYVQRDSAFGHTKELVRLEICIAMARAFNLVESLRGAYFSWKAASICLKVGHVESLVIMMCTCAGLLVGTNPRALDEALALHERGGQLAEKHGGILTAHRSLTKGLVFLMAGRWGDAVVWFKMVLDDLREAGQSSQWELDSASSMYVVACGQMGTYRELSKRLPVFMRDAISRGDGYLSGSLSLGPGSVLWAVSDRTSDGRLDVEEALSRWRPGTDQVDVQRWWGVMALCLFDRYDGDTFGAYKRTAFLIAGGRFSTMRIIRSIWTQIHTTHAINALAVWESDRRSRVLAKQAKSAVADASGLINRKAPSIALLRAGYSAMCGREQETRALLALCVESANRYRMMSMSMFAQYRLGKMLGGGEGERLFSEAEAWLRNEGVVNPKRFVQAHAPGFGGSE